MWPMEMEAIHFILHHHYCSCSSSNSSGLQAFRQIPCLVSPPRLRFSASLIKMFWMLQPSIRMFTCKAVGREWSNIWNIYMHVKKKVCTRLSDWLIEPIHCANLDWGFNTAFPVWLFLIVLYLKSETQGKKVKTENYIKLIWQRILFC